MGSIVSFYLDDTTVQAVTVTVANGMITAMQDARTFSHDELEDYLVASRFKTCILCWNPSSFYQNTFTFPPAASKFYDSLIKTELLKSHPDLEVFTFFYRIIGETTVDGVLMNKISVFTYMDDPLSGHIDTFNRHGKTVSNIYAAPYSIFRLASTVSAEDLEKPRLVVASVPDEKIIVLSLQGEPAFIRKIPAEDSLLHRADVDNINMTIDYCFQSLRVRPAEALLINVGESPDDSQHKVSIPVQAVPLPALAALPTGMADNYIAPLSAALHHAAASTLCGIAPDEYNTFKRTRRILEVFSFVMLIAAVVLCGIALNQWLAISKFKTGIAATRGQLARASDELALYRKLDEEAKKAGKPIDDLNKLSTALNPAAAMAALAGFTSPEWSIREFTTQKAGEGALAVHIEGSLQSTSYSDTQKMYEGALARLAKINGYAISSSSLDITKKTFTIDARFTGGGARK